MSEKHPDTRASEDVAQLLYPDDPEMQVTVEVFGQGVLEEARNVVDHTIEGE